VIVSSHVLHELENVADRFVLVHQGRLIAEGGVAELREQLAERPRKIAVQSRDPRALAARLCGLETVEGLRLAAGAVLLEVRRTGELFDRLTEIGAEPGGLIAGISPLDDHLEAVFGYLVT
jgi:ABC-2 type transport system ATP-binding protein